MNKKVLQFIFAFFFLLGSTGSYAQYVILTTAGQGVEGYAGDAGPANMCQLHWPEAIAIHDSGDMFIADAMNNVVRKIDRKTGKVSTVAGNGFEFGTGHGGFGGDGGQASVARFNYPSGVAVDPIGNLYIADQNNNRIRKVDTGGVVTTIAGNGFVGFGGDGGPATAAAFYHPTRVVLDATGNLYIADSGNNRIRKINTSGVISTVAGNGSRSFTGDGALATLAGLHNPIDMAVDAAGNVFIADYVNNRIRKVDAGGIISTYAGIGIPGFAGDSSQATAANIYEPSGIVVDAAGNVYFSDLANFRVRKIDPAGVITTLAGNGEPGYSGDNGPAQYAQLWFPEGLAIDRRGQVYVADKGNDRVRMISAVLASPMVAGDAARVSLYPNPSQGAFTINIASAINEDARIAITNVAGVRVADFTARTNKPYTIDGSFGFNAPAGMYILSAVTSQGVVNERVIIR